MGELINRRIVQSQIFYDPDAAVTPPYDYDYSYPISVYDAIKKTMDDDSSTLTEEIEAIYRLINSKQDIIEPGIPGQLMTWTGVRGQIGAMAIARAISSNATDRSHTKIPSERAVGEVLDTKVSITDFNIHIQDSNIHVSSADKSKWNAMAPKSSLDAHISNASMHITETERGNWNQKADQKIVDDHIYDRNNPHNVTAHQVGAYSRRETDEMIENIRESFFNYLNISWSDNDNDAQLVEYHPTNWNPNFILKYGDVLPDVPNPGATYFALRPATDYKTDETQDCIIYIKRPGLAWQEVGSQSMSMGDMVIQYPDTTMFVWSQGRFLKLFTGDSDEEITSGISDQLWRPTVNEDGSITWELSKSTEPPTPVVIKGKDGYTPIKGIDYFDGKDGQGVAPGGVSRDLLVKLSDENFDTTWKSFADILNDFVLSGQTLPEGIVGWESIIGRPEWYDSLGDNDDGFITQRAATRQFNVISSDIAALIERLENIEPVKKTLEDHLMAYNNPHRVTPAMIGAVSNATFIDHVGNTDNPHHVTASDIGLGNVNNTSDMDKPISTAVQIALDEITSIIKNITGNVDGLNYISGVSFDTLKCDIILEYKDGSEVPVHIPILEIFDSIYYDKVEKELVIVLPDGSEHRIDISELIQTYTGSTSANVNVTVEDGNIIKATIIPSSVGEYEIAPSVNLRGAPTTMTQPVSDRSTRIATTEFVSNQVIDNLISYETDRPGSANMLRILNEKKADIEDVIQLINDMEGIEVIDNLDSTSPLAALSANMGRYLDLTKAPRVHTSPSGSTYGIATINLFGHAKASNVDPLMDGTVFKGDDDGTFARGTHRHPTDETRAPINFPDKEHNQYELTGEPRAVIAPDDSNDNRIATTEWVRRNAIGVIKGDCDTSKTNPNKVVVLKSTFCNPVVFVRQLGSTVSVLFQYEDRSGSTPTTLNVNDTGAARVIFGGRELKNGMLGERYEHTFVWDNDPTGDGECWRLINPVPGTGYPPIVIGPSKEKDDDTPAMVINKQSGYQGFTVNLDNAADENGQVDDVVFTLNYNPFTYDPEITFSDYEAAFSARMGDATDIILSNPTIINITRSSASIKFKMAKRYPSNSPCQLIYRLNKAWISID